MRMPSPGIKSRRLMAPAALAVLARGCGTFDGVFTGPDDVKVGDPARAVADARRLVLGQRANPDRDRILREPNELPESLRLPGLRYAFVRDDHVDLVPARNPDWNIGARIRSADVKRKHADQPTR